MQTIKNGTLALNVQLDGSEDGAVIMFANSLGTDLRVWDALVALLPAGYRVVRYDKRGHGLSDCPAAPYSLDLLVADAEAIADALRLKDIVFVGLSIGGLIGQGLASKRRDLFKALVLMDTAAKIGTPEMWQTRVKSLREGGIASIAESILDKWFPEPFRSDETRIAPWRTMLIKTPLEGYIGCCEAIAQADYTQTTAKLDLPILAMVGEHDGATPPDLVRETAQLCKAEFKVIEEAGHLPCVQQPEKVAALLTNFIKEVNHA